jgi:hypothetical protein
MRSKLRDKPDYHVLAGGARSRGHRAMGLCLGDAELQRGTKVNLRTTGTSSQNVFPDSAMTPNPTHHDCLMKAHGWLIPLLIEVGIQRQRFQMFSHFY